MAVKPHVGGTLFLLAATLAAGSNLLLTAQEPQPTFRSSIDAVQLSVIVTDSEGNPVSGLTEDDFEVVEDGRTRAITTFSAVDIPIERIERELGEPDVLSNDRPPGRLYVIALDGMAGSNALRTRAFLRRFIEEYFGPNDTAAVVLTTGGPRDSGQEFTSNPRLLLSAIDRFDGGTLSGGTPSPLPPTADAWQREKNFVGDFRTLMSFMATLRGGRKALIFVTEGIPVDAYDVVDRGRARFGGMFSEVNPEWVEALSFATRNNIAVYPINPNGLTTATTAAESFDTTELDTRIGLGGLARVTGGFALTNSNNFTGALERLVRENSSYYLIGFNSGVDERDGRYVRLEVRVKRAGLQVRTTEGYVVPRRTQPPPRRPSTVLAATWDAVASAITTSGVSMRISAAPFKGRGKEAVVPITLEIVPEKLNLVEQDGAYRGQLEIVFAVTDVKKKRWPIWRHRWGLALKPETHERVSKGAMRVVSHLMLPKGRYQLRASAGGAAIAGSVVYDIEIPDFQDDFSLSGVALMSAQANDTFTFSPPGRIDVAFPAPPTTVRQFSQDDTLTVFAQAYEDRKKPHAVTVTLQLRNEAGQVVGTQEFERKAVEKPKQPSAYSFAPTLSLADVPSGRYVLRIEGRSSLDRNKPVTREVPFSVR